VVHIFFSGRVKVGPPNRGFGVTLPDPFDVVLLVMIQTTSVGERRLSYAYWKF
jgi:hypothetical protein